MANSITSATLAPASYGADAGSQGRYAFNGNFVFAMAVLYPFLRFAAGGISLVIPFAFVLLVAIAVSKRGGLQLSLWLAPFSIGFLIAALSCEASGLPQEAIYSVFMVVYFLAIPTFANIKFKFTPGATRLILLAFCLVSLIFLAIPGLEKLGSAKYMLAVAEGAADPFEELAYDPVRSALVLTENRFHAFFIHANEFGLFAAGLLFVAGLGLEGVQSKVKTALDVSIIALLLLFVIISGSISSVFVVAMAFVIRVAQPKIVLWLAFSFFAFFFISQMFFPTAMADWLEEGSFCWRYRVVAETIGQASLFSFAPSELMIAGTWPHSIFLDATHMMGLIGPFVLFALVTGLTFLAVPPLAGAAILIFFISAAVQPSGAMPACFLLLAVTAFRQSSLEKAPG